MEVDASQNPYPVKPTGYLVGSLLACGLYGAHLSQIYRYVGTYSDPLRTRLFVLWVWFLSTFQIIIIVATAWKYYVGGISEPSVWGEFWWPLSVQDGLIPLMAFTAQLFFGRRAWKLLGRPRWLAIGVVVLPAVTFAFGVALAVTARIWANDPWVSAYDFSQRSIGVPSQVVAIVWMGLSALTDGAVTLALIYRFSKARASGQPATRSIARSLIALTLETVLLTHVVGGIMCIIFLASPADHRTNNELFWVLLEIVTELYALSVLFTINSRARVRKVLKGPGYSSSVEIDSKPPETVDFGQTALDRRVEGYQGSTPFGVFVSALEYNHVETPQSVDSNAGALSFSLDSSSQETSSTPKEGTTGGSSLSTAASTGVSEGVGSDGKFQREA